MAVETLQKFSAGSMARGVDVNRSDLSVEFQLLPNSFNLTMGINEGLGPRYGTAALPGQADIEAVAAGKFPGFQKWESGLSFTGSGTNNPLRVSIFGILTFGMRGPGAANIATVGKYYVGMIGYTTNFQAGNYVDCLLFSTLSSSLIAQSTDFTDGQQYAGADTIFGMVSAGLVPLTSEKIPIDQASRTTLTTAMTAQRLTILEMTKQTNGKKYVSSVPFSVSGSNIPMKWMVGNKTAAPDATHAPSMNLSYFPSSFGGAGTIAVACGYPASFVYGNFPTSSRKLTVYTIRAMDTGGISYTADVAPSTSIYKAVYTDSAAATFVDLSATTMAKGGGTAYANVEAALLNDESLVMSSAHQGVLIAAGKPMCFLYQDWYRGPNGEMQQYIDLTVHQLPIATANPLLQAGAANTGILRANTTYEFAVSQFDKRLNFETNVVPISSKLTTAANDFVSCILFNGGGGGVGSNATVAVSLIGGAAETPIFLPGVGTIGSSVPPQHLNYLEYRFYYRLSGTAEWLPALFVDAAKYWFFPEFSTASPLSLCTGGIGGLPGGYPGGFADYSPLPQDTYNCVVIYKNRAFWFSEKAMIFSSVDKMFAYPGRNSISVPAGSFKGAIVHAYPGQAQQDARLVIFSTNGTFVGRFTGQLLDTPVQISVDTVASFGLDGSDFRLDSWTSNSAFSHRSAVVADGVLYFWGPKGVFRDDGVNTPTRISRRWEPDIFTYYDTSRTDEIHAIYNDSTKEIIWFYAPKTADTYPTHALVYSTETEQFVPGKFTFQVDDTAQVDVETSIGTAGMRGMLLARKTSATTIQRPYFYDHRNRAGDQYPTTELMVKQISTPSAGLRRLTLAAGYDAANFATLAVGDYLTLDQVADYAGAGLTLKDNMIAIIAALGAGTIDITLPDGVVFDAAATLTHGQYLPVWHRTPTAVGLNGIAWNLTSKYWTPGGLNLWAYWLYLYLVFKLELLASSFDQTINLQYRTPVSDALSAVDSLIITDNSNGNWQLYHPLAIGHQNIEGQGLKLVLSGIHIGSKWVLQYLEAHATALEGEQLKIFEG